MKSVADIVPFVRFKARHDNEANIQHAVRETVIAFMRESRAAVNELFISIPTTCGFNEALLETPNCERLVGIESVWCAPKNCDSKRWTPLWDGVPNIDVGQPELRFDSQLGYWVDDVGGPQTTLWLNSFERKTQHLCVRYSWAIKRDDCLFPDWIYDDYAGVITEGALAYLHDNPDDDHAASSFAARMDLRFMQEAKALRERKRSNYSARNLQLGTRWGRAG
jgi:hypothetical protein